MALLKETYAFTEKPLFEEAIDPITGQKKKNLYLQGLFLQGEVENRNGRIYPRRIIEQAVKDLQDRLASGETIYGELEHPESMMVGADRISHMITEIHMEGNDGYGKLKVFDTPKVPCGELVAGLIENGGTLGVSSRGSGELDDITGIVKDYQISTIDIVVTPSAQKAYPKPIFESIFNTKKGKALLDVHQARYEGDNDAVKCFNKVMTDFINSLTF